MMTRIEIRNGKSSTYKHRAQIKRLGFKYKDAGKWEKECKKNEIPKIKSFCKKHKLSCSIYEEGYTRSSSYRKRYFDEHPGFFGLYRCSYCGRIRTKKHITVDHIIPVDKVVKSEKRNRYKRILNLRGISDINDVRNLTSSCKACNLRKSSKTGGWVIRGMVGKNAAFWVFRDIILAILIGFCILYPLHTFSFFTGLIRTAISNILGGLYA